MYKQQVDCPMIQGTVALACGWHPSDENANNIEKYESDYQAVRPRLFTTISSLVCAKSFKEQSAAKHMILEDFDHPNIFCFVSQALGLASTTCSEAEF